MKRTQLFKTLGLIAMTTFATLAAGTGTARADTTFVAAGVWSANPYLADPGRHGQHRPDYRHDHRPGHFAAPGRYRQIESRQDRQMDRIQSGIARGEITKREAAKLFQQQREIEHLQRAFMADGHLSGREYAALDNALDDASRYIHHQAHDNEWRW